MDFRILKQKTFYDQYIRLEPKDHQEIIEIINKLNVPLLKRITDYYGDDIKYKPYEYADLKKEIDEVNKILQDKKLIKLLNELKEVVNVAEKNNKPIEVLTD